MASFCVNPPCRREIAPMWAFCAYCGQDNRMPLQRTPVRGCSHQFPFPGSYCCLCGTADAALPQRPRFSLWTFLFQPRSDTRLRLVVSILMTAFILLMMVSRAWPNPQNAQAARALVQNAYEAARTGSDLPGTSSKRDWQTNQDLYGPVLTYRIVRENQNFFRNNEYTLEVEVTRSRTPTRERVEVWAGPSKLYGYSTFIMHIAVEPMTSIR